jgi:hypothetical protein
VESHGQCAPGGRLHGESGDGRKILHHDLNVHRFRYTGEVPHHRIGIEFRHTRRADHYRRCALLLRRARKLNARSQSVGGGAGDDGRATRGLPHHGLENGVTLGLVQPRYFTRNA